MFTAVSIAVFILFVLFQVCLLGGAVMSFFSRKRLGGKMVAAVWVGVAAILFIEGTHAVRWRPAFILFVLFQVCLLGGGVISFFFRKRLGGKVVAAV